MPIYKDFEYLKNYLDEESGVGINKYLGTDKTVIIPETIENMPVRIINETFRDCDFVEKVVLPESVKQINGGAFQNCVNLVDVNIPKSVTMLSYNVFKNCKSLENIDLHNEITYICEKCFEGCDSLKTIKLPENLEQINNEVFANCPLIENIEFPKTIKEWGFDLFKNSPKMIDERGFVIVHDTIFLNYYGKEENVVVPSNITHINRRAFSKNKKIKSVVLPDGLKSIEYSAFKLCVNLESIEIPKTVEIIHEQAFFGCESLTEMHFPESVMKFRTKTFAGCNNLKKINFEHSKELSKTVTVTKTSFPFVENEINPHPILLKSWSKEQALKLNFNKLARFDELDADTQKLFKAELSKKTLRDAVFLKGTSADISKCLELGIKVKLIDLDTYLEHSIKNEKTEITAILLRYKEQEFSTKVKEKFEENKDLVEVGLELPTLTQLRQKWDVKVSKDHISILRYKGNNTMEIVPPSISTGKPISCIGDGNVNSDWGCLEEINIPSTITEIKEQAFSGSMIKKITLPNSITVLPWAVFWGCEKLEKVILPENLIKIGQGAFNRCDSLSEITLPESLEIIYDNTFFRCTSLEEITLPKNLKTVCYDAFEECTNLKKVILENDTVEIHKDAFFDCENLEFVGTNGGENIIGQFLDYVERGKS